MTVWEALAVALAGLGAGTINAVVGSGTLITFPVLLAVGYPPVLANVSNTVGLVPGSLSSVVGYRAELAGQRDRLTRLGAASVLGAGAGATALLVLPDGAFGAIVPVLIGLGCLLVVLQPRLSRWLAARTPGDRTRVGPLLLGAVLLTGAYGGYFGAAQGVLLIAIMGVLLDESLQRVNAAKNVLAFLVNTVAAAVFVSVTDIAWAAAGLIAVGSVVGGQLGSRLGRRVPSTVLRGIVVVVGLVALVTLVVG